jgi:hypothetical protein
MRSNQIAIAATAGAAIVGVLMSAQPATAASNAANNKVTVTVKAASGPVRSATLTCQPVGGTHQAAADACALLTAAGGDPAAIPPADLMCTMEYAPVKVKVVGKFNGKTVKYKKRFSNSCRTTVEGGALFSI